MLLPDPDFHFTESREARCRDCQKWFTEGAGDGGGTIEWGDDELGCYLVCLCSECAKTYNQDEEE